MSKIKEEFSNESDIQIYIYIERESERIRDKRLLFERNYFE